MDKTAIIIGGGPAGLTAGYELIKKGIKPIILEADNILGGLSKTVEFNSNYFELGPHRLFTKDEQILKLWNELLPFQGMPASDDIKLNRDKSLLKGTSNPETEDKVMLIRQRFSRIYYLKKFFDYPIKMNLKTISNLGFLRTFCAGMSYMKSMAFKKNEVTLEDFMINKFGKVLYKMFFEDYTQKVWGKHPSEISKEWGEQRIKGLSLRKVLMNMFIKSKEVSLTDYYYYPKFGCGQLWNTMADYIKGNGGEIHLNSKVVSLEKDGNKIVSVTDNNSNKYYGDYIISTMPVQELLCNMNDVPEDIKYIAENLEYRDYQLVTYILDDFNLKNNTNFPTINNICPDSWIYMQEREVKIGRIQVMNNWSPYIIKNLDKEYVIGLEYFCSKGDELWEMSDEEILDFGISELEKLNITSKSNIISSKRFKVEKAYPAYFGVYEKFDDVKNYINSIENLYCAGRNGQHKYNNIDHSILSGIEAANAVTGEVSKEILWKVNTEKSYQETK